MYTNDQKTKTIKNATFTTLAGLALALTGCGTTTSTPDPTVTATETVTETTTETVEKTPQACLDYIEVAEKVITSAGEVIAAQKDGLETSGEVIDSFGRADAGDIAAIQDATERIKAENETIAGLTPEIQAAKAGCQAGA